MGVATDTTSAGDATDGWLALRVEMVEADDAVVVRVGGAWDIASAGAVDGAMRGFWPRPRLKVRFDFSALGALIQPAP